MNNEMLSYLLNTEGTWLWIDCSIYNFTTFNYVEGSIDPPPNELTFPPKVDPEYFATLISVTLRSQMRFCVRSKGKTLIYDSDLRAIEACPVILASTLSYPKNVLKIERRSPYPPLEHGTAATVFKQAYHITDLSKEAQERQKQISKMLEALPTQPIETPNSFVYPTCPEELTNMIQQLAQDYYQYHTNIRIPNPRNIFTNGATETLSCMPFQAAIASIHDAASKATKWVQTEDHAPYFRYEKPSGSSIIEYKTGRKDEVFNSKTTTSLWQQVQKFSDSSNDVLLALCAHFIRPSEEDGTTWFFASQYLSDRGLAKITKGENTVQRRTAGHRHEDIAEVGNHLDLLENIWITIDQTIDQPSNGKKKRKKRQFTHQGRLLMIEERITQKDLHGENNSDLEIAWRIRPGSWLRPFLEAPNRQVANLFQKSLQYDPYRQQWEKRLSRYFMFFGHMETRGGGGTFNRNIKKLLQEVSLSVDSEHPKRTKKRFEEAMNQLVADNIINEWYYQGSVDTAKRGWVTSWLDLMITIHIAPVKRLT